MMEIVRADGSAEKRLLSQIKQRSGEVDKEVTLRVQDILEQVRARGDEAVLDYTERFDGCRPSCLEVPKEELERAVAECDPPVLSALRRAADNIADFHARQKQQSWLNPKENGVILGQRVRGLERVGLYVPGGTAAYPSSVLMNAIPAKIAGVKELIMVTPPGRGGINRNILAAAQVAGVSRVFQVGGAQAVAALAYGTQSVPKVDKVVGPGNIYVATAKRLLYGLVDIDMIAGPSEILIVADDTANPAFVAADLMSQAEHDRLASAILLTTSSRLAEETARELEKQSSQLERNSIIQESLRHYGAMIICEDLSQALNFANDLAPEHLELCIENPMEWIGRVDNAGSVFLGHYSPEALGDYYAGPNHVLPTSGTARFFSPLSVDSFIKKSSFIYYTREALAQDAGDIVCLANAEGLTAHANSVKVRFYSKEG